MKKHPIIIAAGLLLASSAEARLGETSQQCTARYGTPVNVDKEQQLLSFSKGGMFIVCAFRDGVCVQIAFRHAESDALENPTKLTDAEIETLLAANGGGKKWEDHKAISVNREWVTEDGSVVAQYQTFKNFLFILTKAELDRQNAEAAAKDKSKLKDF